MIPWGVIAASGNATPPGPSATFRTFVSSGSNAASYTFTDVPVGEAASARVVVVAFYWRAVGTTAAPTSVTIGGVSATVDINAANTAGGNQSVVTIAHATVPTGTTATVVLNLSGASLRMGCAVYTIDAAVTVEGSTSSTTDAAAMTVDTVPGALVIAASDNFGPTANTYHGEPTWTGATIAHYTTITSEGTATSGAIAVATGTSTDVTVDWPDTYPHTYMQSAAVAYDAT